MSVILSQLIAASRSKDRMLLQSYYNILQKEKEILQEWFTRFEKASTGKFHKTTASDSRKKFDTTWELYDDNVELLHTCTHFIRELR